jgi:hypothetical protein
MKLLVTDDPAITRLVEDQLAASGFALVSHATLRIVERIEQSPSSVSLDDYERVLYEIFSGPYGVHHKVLA